ncbi:MAG: CBS domain-containing protein, partial [Thermoanaerobaculia bacterium]|nr:CBS domain-containing protein [Thermoanaerobaculia bacterium]
MGSFDVRLPRSPSEVREFTRAALADVAALEAMLAADALEVEPIRMGAEQEMYLVDAEPPHWPLPIATDVLAGERDPKLSSELALFNIEVNLDPVVLE